MQGFRRSQACFVALGPCLNAMTTSDLHVISCPGKHAFPTWANARNAAKHLARRDGFYVSAYRCMECHRIHVGNWQPNVRIKLYKHRRKELEEHERQLSDGDQAARRSVAGT